ncbi:MAG: nuclear transport factor 2 family protein [Bacteroidia bacterium]
MNSNEQLITTFYKAFQSKDYKTMQRCYADDAVFNDAVFKNLNALQVRAMWEMLIKRGKDLQLEFKNVKADDTTGSAEWIATYTFTATKHKVVNHIQASFLFENGLIAKHTDSFNFYKWARQALGFPGFILGWTGFLKNKVQQTAMKNLAEFMGGKKQT